MTDPIKAKIIELCPDVMEYKNVGLRKGRWECECGATNGSIFTACQSCRTEKPKISNDITLAVVLRAVEKARTIEQPVLRVYADGEMVVHEEHRRIFWNLAKDNYDEQSQETKDFIGTLLDV